MTVKTLGDPHLGRAFIHGVPLARRGDREKMQWADFEASLLNMDHFEYHVCMGDIFDKWTVPYTVIFKAAEIYRAAAAMFPEAQFVLLAGNHDLSRDIERISAFRLLASIIEGIDNIHVVYDQPLRIKEHIFIPWHPVLTAAEMVDKYADDFEGAQVAYGHWDVVAVSDTDNLLPARQLKDLGITRAVTGHDHVRRELTLDGLSVSVTGSMQPYSFSEDPRGELYVTMTLDEFEACDKASLKNKCVRVQLEEGEEVDTVPDCLLFRTQRIGQEDEDAEPIEVNLGGFSFDTVFMEVFNEVGVSEDVTTLTLARVEAERAKQ